MGPEGISWVGLTASHRTRVKKKNEMTQSYVYTQSPFRYLFGCMCVFLFFLWLSFRRE